MTLSLLLIILLIATACNYLNAYVHTSFHALKLSPHGRFAKSPVQSSFLQQRNYPSQIARRRLQPLHDILGLGPTELVLIMVGALVLFGPETLKSLSKDVGRAAAELKEIPKTFKEGMEEGVESAQVAKMKAIAAEKKKKREQKEKKDDDEEVEDDDA